ncbi:MAG: hypothetical protein ABA06_00520 [Parcubacteria bacterium C7867-001]|nr:MAG: hypothetical protein ABA06_00520 [Parcubacteria bacterium C7867-001]
MKRATKKKTKKLPIDYWSHSSLMAFLRNPLTWHKRYVEKIYDLPRTPASVIGSAGHYALELFYNGALKEEAIKEGLDYIRRISDFELNFGVAKSKKEKRAKRASMERDYVQAINFYLARPPRHKVIGVEVKSMASVPGLPLPVKAISDLVVESKGNPGMVDIVDHKFVDSFSKGSDKPAFALQALFNYYTVTELYGKPVCRFIVYECKKRKNADGRPQLRKYVLVYSEIEDMFLFFHRLLQDATDELARERAYLPNPSDMFEGDHSVDLYRLGLVNQ